MNCDPLAPWYRWLEYAGFGRALERRRLAFLPQLADAQSVLMLGEGDGRFLAAFLRANSSAVVDYVDSSGKLLALARARTLIIAPSVKGRVRFHQAEAESWLRSSTPRSYDLICTHFFLDCFTTEQLAPLVGEIGRCAEKHAVWIVSEFRYPSGGLMGWAARFFIGLLYRFFRWFTALRVDRLPDHGSALRHAGFRLIDQQCALGGLLISERWQRA